MPLSTVLGAQSLIKPGVCTTATRPASPYTGQMIYDTTLSQVFVYNGSAWVIQTTGLVPIIPTSVAVGSGTATVGTTGLITFSTVGTNLSVNGCFTSAYNNYKVMFVCSSAATNSMTMRLRASGTDSSATNYWYNWVYGNTTTAYWESVYSTSWAMSVSGKISRNFIGDFLDPFKASPTSFMGNMNENTAGSGGGGGSFSNQNTASTSYDGFSVIPSGSTMTGTMVIYGYN